MTLEAASSVLAEHLLSQEYVEVYGHHDADGIAAASIICHALLRAGKKFRLRIVPQILSGEISTDTPVLLCDMGSSDEALPGHVMVVDHHPAAFDGEYHVNPRLFGVDGETELSAAGAAYLVANHMGDNRDLCGLALIGMIGDRQSMTGINQDIAGEGIAQGFLTPRRGLRLVGRDNEESLYLSIQPCIAGISGNQERVEEILDWSSVDGAVEEDLLLSALVMEMSEKSNASALCALYGDTWEIERGIVHDAHSLCALVDACGHAGKGGLGAMLCMRSSNAVDEAWEVMREFRIRVIEGIKKVHRISPDFPLFESDDPAVVSDLAEVLAFEGDESGPVAVFARAKGGYLVSARSVDPSGCDIGHLLARIAPECGGKGGGHLRRGGAFIPPEGIETFNRLFQEAAA